MNAIVALLLSPVGFVASFARPFLSFGGFAFLVSGGWAYVNPGWVDPSFAWRLLAIAGTCYALRYGADLLQAAIINRI